MNKIKIGISACLLGLPVRFDSGHKKDRYLTDVLDKYFQWMPVCPEVGIGMGTPRESVRLVRLDDTIQMIAPKSGQNFTRPMHEYSAKLVGELQAQQSLGGFILKSNSPTCGMERVRVYDHHQVPSRSGVGIFAQILMKRFPLLPVEEEGRLNDPRLRENFIARVFAYQRLREFLNSDPDPHSLITFHTRHKLQLMSHDLVKYRELGRIAAGAEGDISFSERAEQYGKLFMETLRHKPSTKKHTNVMHHILGYFKKRLPAPDRHELADLIEQYRSGYVPLVVPLTLFAHHLRKQSITWLDRQFYFNPYPQELMLRNLI